MREESFQTPGSDALKPGEPVYRSPLDKPLSELTEEDISQLTREDCRKYLKDKGPIFPLPLPFLYLHYCTYSSALKKKKRNVGEKKKLRTRVRLCLFRTGMRRPSWNKSQAIQQVISLKTLFESRPDSGDAAAGIRQKIASSEPENPPHVRRNIFHFFRFSFSNF